MGRKWSRWCLLLRLSKFETGLDLDKLARFSAFLKSVTDNLNNLIDAVE
jgi:hypothetical protein